MSKTLAEGHGDSNSGGEDGVVTIEADSLVASKDGVDAFMEKEVKESGEESVEEPIEVITKDTEPPDGGYGWVVVAYDTVL